MPKLSPLKGHGGKSALAKAIVDLFPVHTHYVETHAYTLAVLLTRSPDATSEVANDIDGRITNFWRVLRDVETFELFKRMCEATPFSRPEWDLSRREARYDRGITEYDDMDPEQRAYCAWSFFVSCRQSLAARATDFAALSRVRVRRGMNEQASAWLTAVDGLAEIHHRLKRVVIDCRDAKDIIRSEQGDQTLFYVDPPYLPEARSAVDIYGYEMTPEQHAELLDTILASKGKFVISGYHSDLYHEKLKGWTVKEFAVVAHSGHGKKKKPRIEVLWMNY